MWEGNLKTNNVASVIRSGTENSGPSGIQTRLHKYESATPLTKSQCGNCLSETLIYMYMIHVVCYLQ